MRSINWRRKLLSYSVQPPQDSGEVTFRGNVCTKTFSSLQRLQANVEKARRQIPAYHSNMPPRKVKQASA